MEGDCQSHTLTATADKSLSPRPPGTGTGALVLKGDGRMKGFRGEHACAPIGAPVGILMRRPLCCLTDPPPVLLPAAL